tara:strand:- start:302 stop:607 length:306 start_codon:yes stop_codon:yes gene_type:complete
MIAFREGQSPDDEFSIPKEKLKEIIKSALLKKASSPSVSSYYGNLSPTQIEMIISHLMYTKAAESINITINKEDDGYHLGMTIHDIQDEDGNYSDDDSLYL